MVIITIGNQECVLDDRNYVTKRSNLSQVMKHIVALYMDQPYLLISASIFLKQTSDKNTQKE